MSESQFLQQLQELNEIIYLNEMKYNVATIINGFTVCDPPDFVFGEHYAERFEVDDYKRERNKTGKLASLHLHHEQQLKERLEIPQHIFHAAHYSSPKDRTNIRYLRENIELLIADKTAKQIKYDVANPSVKYRHLFIDIRCYSEILADENGQYSNTVVHDKQMHREIYEIYRDLHFIESIQSKYREYWDMLLFVSYYHDMDVHKCLVHCIDLKNPLENKNMIVYPKTPFQIIKEGNQVLQIQGWISTTNVKYKTNNGKNPIYDTNIEQLDIEDFSLYPYHTLDSIYATEDNAFLLETSQLAMAVNPKAPPELLTKYIPHLLKKNLHMVFRGSVYILTRKTCLEEYYYEVDRCGYYRLDDKTSFRLSLLG